MKTENNNVADLLKSAIQDSLTTYESFNSGNYLGDIYIYYNSKDQTLCFFDDIENKLVEKTVVFQEEKLIKILKSVLKEMEKDRAFNKKFIYKPFTVNFVDKDFTILEELIFIDDDTIQLDNEVWSNMDEELNNFFTNLMK